MTDREPDIQREVIVTNGGGSGTGMIFAAVILVLGVIFAIWYFNNSNSGDISIPSDVNINVNTDDPGTATTANTGN